MTLPSKDHPWRKDFNLRRKARCWTCGAFLNIPGVRRMGLRCSLCAGIVRRMRTICIICGVEGDSDSLLALCTKCAKNSDKRAKS